MKSRLSPEARARLEAARALAQGKPAPAPAASTGAGGRPAAPAKGSPAPQAAGARDPQGSDAPSDTPSKGTGGRLALAALLGVAILGTVAVAGRLLGGSRPDLVGNTAAIQKGLLDGGSDDAARRKAMAEVIRNADQMTRQELDSARKALDEEWQRSRDAAILAYFDAPDGDKSRLADEGIDRTLAYRKLRFGLSPQAPQEGGGRKQKPPKDEDRRKLFTRYGEALQAQAKKRGIPLPEWQ